MRLTENFTRRELDRHSEIAEGSALWHNMTQLAENLQRIRDEVGVPVSVSRHGGYHGPHFDEHWRKRSPGSQHRKARAADLRAKGMTPRELHAVILRLIAEGKIEQGGVGLYDGPGGYVHYDTRGRAARWRGTP